MSLLYRRRPKVEERAPVGGFPALSWQGLLDSFRIGGQTYVAADYGAGSLVHQCGPAYSVLDRRASIVGEARFAFQAFSQGKPDRMFATAELAILEQPWRGGSTRQLMAVMELDVATSGNSYWIRQDDELVRIPPEWVTVGTQRVDGVSGEAGKPAPIGERLVGYVVQMPGWAPTAYAPEQVAHYRPSPSPESQWRGESWLAAVATDGASDLEMTRYKQAYLRNGALPSIAVTYEPTIDPAVLEQFVGVFADKFTGAMNAGKVLHFLGGRDVKTVGATLDQLAFKAVQGAGETRIAAAAGVPAVISMLSEGLQGSSLNSGNFGANRRLFADAKVRPLLGAAADALSHVVRVPSGARLWYDDSASFFQEDVADEADIRLKKAQTMRTLTDGGWEADAAVEYAETGNMGALIGAHSGLLSVQMQEPGAAEAGGEEEP